MKKRFTLCAIFISFVILTNAQRIAAAGEAKQAAVKLNKNLSLASNNFTVSYYRCDWTIDPSVRFIRGSVTSYFNITKKTSSIIYDFTAVLKVDSIIQRNKKLNFTQNPNNTLTINFSSPFAAGKKDSISVYYKGVPPESGDFTGGFTQTTHNNTPIIWTLSEPYGASGWWPCRNGLDDKADSLDVYITHALLYTSSSNGVLVSSKKNGNYRTDHFRHRYPIASYLVAIAVTNYSTFTDSVKIAGKFLPFVSHVYPEDLSYFQSAKQPVLNALSLYSKRFGTYPFINEQYGETEFSWGGGMEHQTNSFVVSAGTNLVTHELGHQWFGDKVTCASWHDIWLNEGFATYLADFIYTENFDPAAYDYNVESNLSYIVSSPNGSVYVDDTTDVYRIFDSRLSYSKGAFLLRMLRWTLGDADFFKGIRSYLTDSLLKYGFASTADLQRNLEEASGKNLNFFFKQWFYGEGYPSFHVKWLQPSATGDVKFSVNETTSDASVAFYKSKLQLRLTGSSKARMIILDVNQNGQSFTINNPGFTVTSVSVDPEHYLISNNNTVTKQTADDNFITATPNPIQKEAYITLHNFSEGAAMLHLYNSSGVLLWQQKVIISGSKTSISIPFKEYVSGTYTVTAMAGNHLYKANIIK